MDYRRSDAKMIAEAASDLADKAFTWKRRALEAEATLSFIRQAATEYREAPFRSADWLASQVVDSLDGHLPTALTDQPADDTGERA